MHYLRLGGLALAACGLLLTGCQSTPQRPADAVIEPALPAVYLPSWQAQGKLSLRRAEDSTNASFRWRQHLDNYVVYLHGPFGQGATWLRRTTKGVTLENAEVGLYSAPTAEELMEQMVGWQVPVSGLRYWVTGVAAPDAPAEVTGTDEQGRITGLTQAGWDIRFDRYTEIDGVHLPGKVVAERDDIKATLIVKNWTVPLNLHDL